ncbi:Leucine-rich repeat-containing protein 16A [Myotis brandtii]|uniref:Leucine-rich repeat-containing protein 16A n=2 Tax=Myotis brandtii TaxID=109478 RepID=S7P6A3_MYOBR|nr:Leucine-rich repeat-containing protein 16A [Myotis brandtii]
MTDFTELFRTKNGSHGPGSQRLCGLSLGRADRTAVLTTCRAFLLAARIPSKLELTFSYLDIQGVTCSKPAQMAVETGKHSLSLRMAAPEDVSEVLVHLGSCLRRIFPGLSPLKILKRVSMEPSERLASLQADFTVASPKTCPVSAYVPGGFSQMYACVCDWLGFPYREEVQWDVDTIYLTQDTRELNLQDFSHLDHRDLIPIIAALEYNQWFSTLSSKDLRLSSDVCEQILRVVSRSGRLEELVLENAGLRTVAQAVTVTRAWLQVCGAANACVLLQSSDVCEQILRVVSRSGRLEELVLENAGLRTDFAQKLASALAHNPGSGLHTINLSGNALEDRGVSSLSVQFAKLPKGLKHLNLSKTSLSPKGVNCLSQSLSANPLTATTLTHLDLSGNALRGDDLSPMYSFLAQPNALTHLDLSGTECALDMPMYSFLAQPNALTHLDLSGTECALDMVCAALLRGCLQYLAVLNLSRTVFSHRKGKEVPPSFRQFFSSSLALTHINLSGTKLAPEPLKQFFSSSLALTHINLSGTKLAPEPLKALLLSLTSNRSLKAVSLDLSSCELRSGGAQVLEGCIAEIHNITSLDISDNGLESDLSTLIVWLSRNRSIQHLALGKNFNNMKPKNLTPVLDSLVQMIQDEESPLQSLSLADSKLKTEVTIIINALGSNTSLTKVDISGNAMGDMGAKMLAKALQINTKLRTVIWDKNNISAQGFQDIAVAMEKNYTLRFMPIPMYDAAQALKTNPEKTEEALQKIENYLLRNHETRKYQQEQAYRLQQGIVTSTTQQMIDRMCVKVQDHLNSLRNCGGDAVQEDVRSAERLMRDAKNSKTLLPNLYHVGSASWAGAGGLLSSPVQETLESMAGEVTRVVDEQLKALLESMVDAAESLCPHVMRKAHIRQDLIHAGSEKLSVPRTFVKNVLLEQSGVDILNKISEVKLTVASFLSDRIVDELLDALSLCHHRLGMRGEARVTTSTGQVSIWEESDHFSRRGRTLPAPEALDAEPVDEKPARRPVLAVEELTELERLEEQDTCLACVGATGEQPCQTRDTPGVTQLFAMTPKSKRKTIHSRMLRPVSHSCLPHVQQERGLAPKGCSHPPTGALSPLGDQPGQDQLSPVSVATVGPQDGERNGLMGRVDEGVDEFFTKKVTRRRSSARGPEAQDPGDGGDEKKKRESRRSGFLNLIKPRSKPERPPTVLMADEPSSPKGAGRGPAMDTPRRDARPAEQDSPSLGFVPAGPAPVQGQGPGGSEGGRFTQQLSQGGAEEPRSPWPAQLSGQSVGLRTAGSRVRFRARTKLGNEAASQDPPSPASSAEQLDGGGAVPRLHPALPGTPEKNAKADPRVDAGFRGRSASSLSVCGKKRCSRWRNRLRSRVTRACVSTEDVPDSPPGLGSPRAALLPPVLRKVPVDKEREGQGSPQPSPRPFSQEVWRSSWGQQPQEYRDQKPRSPSKDGRQGSKSSDSGEEAEKEFIFV